MKAVVVQFDHEGDRYESLLKTLIESWKAHAKIPLEIHRIPVPEIGKRNKGFYFNHEKLRHWIDAVDQDTIFIDADMLCMSDISHGFDQVEHIGITERPGAFPVNGGVVFVRNTPEAKDFLRKWHEIDGQMLDDIDFHLKYHPRYAGMNQSSLGWMLENGYGDLAARLPCSEYNLCDGQWDQWESARMIHIKGRLRTLILEGKLPIRYHPKEDSMKEIAEIWNRYNPQKKEVSKLSI